MAYNTPPRTLPGTYLQTPAPSRAVSSVRALQRTSFSPARPFPPAESNAVAQVGQQVQQTQATAPSSGNRGSDLKSRAGRAIDHVFRYEIEHPDLDTYVGQGVSNLYDTSNDASWDPFQVVKMYPIPDDIYNQYNHAQVSTSMGLFADLDQAWVSIDNALYLWDYTNPSSVNLQGVDNQPSVITAVHFTVPREGVFLPEIKYLLVLATFTAVSIFGISIDDSRGGGKSIKIHDPGMSASVKGLDVNVFASSRKTGRIFFAGRGDNDVYELNYQQEERWFHGKATKTNHVTGLISTQTVWRSHTNLYVISMCVDDSRQLLYTLSSNSSIRVFHMKEGGILELAITKEISSTFTDIGNRATGNIMSETLNTSIRLISISPIPSQEATKLHLMATTNTGYRIYFSATTSHGWLVSGSSQAPRSLQVQHVKLPPRVQGPDGAQIASNQGTTASNQGPTESNHSIKTLTVARVAARIPPGYFLCFTYNPQLNQPDTLFISAVDSGRTARAPLAAQLTGSRFHENQMWIRLPGQTEDLGMRTPAYAGAEKPAGFGYEPSMQFDKATPEIAILTNAGVHVIRRRRLVDIFAAFARQGSSGDESRAAQVRSFINRYGRRETIATALAVACGQGVEVSSDFRSTKMTDVAVLNFAREIFLKEGGKATLNENLVESQINPIDAVRPSPRHFGLTLYLSRLIRSIWSGIIVKEVSTPAGGKQILPSVPVTKLQEIQSGLISLQEFLKKEKNSIDGLSGSAILSRAATQSEELSYQGEHRDMQAVVQFIDSTIEGISFILVLFDERVEEIVALLSEESRRPFMAWTFKDLFTQQSRDLGKEVIKAVVNRNIAKGANVETIAEALRRRCGSFCSADDVVIFRAQELLKRASETGSNAESSRNRLNESLRLFKQVAQSLPMDYLTSAVELYVLLHFFAGAIELALAVAQQSDKANLALSWMKDRDAPRVDALGRASNGTETSGDTRKAHFEFRKQCYDHIHLVILALDEIASRDPDSFTGKFSMMNKRRTEAYEVINGTSDEVFLSNLYDWYLSQGWQDRILEAGTEFVVTYLSRRAQDDLAHADLLWQFYVQKKQFYDAASIQFEIAQSSFFLTLDKRIEYLSRAKANISTRAPQGNGPRSWQELKQRISDYLDLANVQDDILQRLKEDTRLVGDNRLETLGKIDGPILTIQELFHGYADQAGYWDICLMIFLIANTHDAVAIRTTWSHLIDTTHAEALKDNIARPFEAMIEKVRNIGFRVRMSETVFPVREILPLLEQYKFELQRDVGPPTWVVDLFLELEVAHETIYSTLEGILYNNEAPFMDRNRRVIGNDLVYLIGMWLMESGRGGAQIFGSDAIANEVSTLLQTLQQNGVTDDHWTNEARMLRARIEQLLR